MSGVPRRGGLGHGGVVGLGEVVEEEVAQDAWTITEPKPNLLNLPHDLTLWKSIMRGLSPYHRILSSAPDEILSN